jgi:hypothetical protein
LPTAKKGVKTYGVLVSRGSTESLVSGKGGPASRIAKGTPGFTGLTRTHVEGHAAAVMREEGIERAALFLNRPPCSVRPGCDANLERMLPPGAKLTVFFPGGKKVYTGRKGKP